MQYLKDVQLTAISLVDDPAVPKAYFRIVKRNEKLKTDDVIVDKVLTDSITPVDLTPLYTKVDGVEKRMDNCIKEINTIVSAYVVQMDEKLGAVQKQLESMQKQYDGQIEPKDEWTELANDWLETFTRVQVSHQNGEIDSVIYSQLLGEIEQGLSQF